MKLLSTCDIFEKTVYRVGKNQSLLDISKKLKIPPMFLILDNNLKFPPKEGDLLIAARRGEIFVLDDEILRQMTDDDKKQLMLKNKVDYLFIGQILLK
jgi:hypothetical protein